VPQWEACKYAIGGTGPAGGIVFYVTDGGTHGLEAAPADQGTAPWGCNGTAIPGADSHVVGAGKQNTLDILAGCKEVGIGAKIADDYSLNGYNDWYLPSIDELFYMSRNIGPAAAAPLTNVGFFTVSDYPIRTTTTYQSSSETDANSNWGWAFTATGNSVKFYVKLLTGLIRPIRTF
jgi:hypothetical protein